jgi:hypothetical protein
VKIVDGPTADTGEDDWYPGPPRPSRELRFLVRYDEYPGGPLAYWRDYRAALALYFEYQPAHHRWGADEGEAGSDDEVTETPQQKVDRYAYYALKRRVFDVSVVVAALAGITRRNLAHWLVKSRGFPWRGNCSVDDLNRLLAFLHDPATVTLARAVPDYPLHVRYGDEDDEQLLAPAAVHEALVRHAAHEVSVQQAAELLGPTLDAATKEREDIGYRDEHDAWDVLEAGRMPVLGELRHRALIKAVRAQAADR